MMLGLQTCLLAACTGELNDPAAGGGNDLLELNFSIASTRTSLDDSGAGSFSEGDRVGLYIDNGTAVDYRELTLTGGEWQPQLLRSDFGSGELTLAACYPALSAEAGEEPAAEFVLAADQSAEGFAASDLLFAQRSLPAGSNRVEMSFTHAMHRLRIELSGDEQVLAVGLRSRMKGRVDLLTGGLTPAEEFGWITPRRNADGSYEAIIFPQSVEPFRSDEGLLRITTSEREIIYKAPETLDGAPLERFEAGRQLTLRLTLRKPSGGDSELANRSLWVYGLSAPDFPGEDNLPTYDVVFDAGRIPAGVWFRQNYSDMEIENLTWSEGCGWYDCNKSYDYAELDSSLCWAATASNLLLWWMTMNKEYIAAYDAAYYGSKTPSVVAAESGRVFERPAPEFKLFQDDAASNRSPVFQFFKSLFSKSGWETDGVNWFITGDIGMLQTNSLMWGFPGFFSEVFKQSDVIAEDSQRYPTGEVFNSFVTEALQSRKALSISPTDYNGSSVGNHAMTLWGAEYDENGIISHVYFCDNNLGDQDANGAVISRFQIVYDADMSKGYTYLQPLYRPTARMRIMSVGSVDLRRDIWAREYPSVQPEK